LINTELSLADIARLNSSSTQTLKSRTQTESLGFKIDLTVHHNGKKLAIECDGPTHFEGGDGQVYVQSDWERQGALEAAGWNFYRISYFDWVSDQAGEEKALSDYLAEYFDDEHKASKTEVVKELEKETVAPEDAPKEMYVTDFSDERVDNSTPINPQTTPKSQKSNTSSNKGFSVGSREVNQDAFGDYLKARVSNNISIRYQSTRAGSAKYWRTLSLLEFNDTYFSAFDSYARINKVFRRDRVVEFK
jgi:very-short-patch-repair endonuclease